MNTVSKESPQTNVNWLKDQMVKTAIPLGIKIAAGSIATWSNPLDVAVAFVAQKGLSHLGEEGISQLKKQIAFQLSPKQEAILTVGNLAFAFFGAQSISQRLGFATTYSAVLQGTAVYVAFLIGTIQQKLKLNEDLFKNENNVITVTKENFQEEVENSTLPVVLDVYANWCPPCRMVAPIIGQLAEEMEGKVKFVKMNIDNESELGEKLNVRAMPTFVYFKDGKEIHRHEGAGTKERFIEEMKVLQ